jgi:tetratricopeptide (TPR) repeat protein
MLCTVHRADGGSHVARAANRRPQRHRLLASDQVTDLIRAAVRQLLPPLPGAAGQQQHPQAKHVDVGIWFAAIAAGYAIDCLSTDPAERARWLNAVGVALSQLGRPAEALPVTEEAVAARRELAAASPDRYRPDLARSLTSLAAILDALGRTDEAEKIQNDAAAS